MRVRFNCFVNSRVVLGLVVVVGIAASMSATAAARPRVSLGLPATADALASIPFTFAARGLPRGSTLVVQRQQGTRHVWRTSQRLHGPAGNASLRGLPLGIYKVRIAALAPHRGLVAQQRHDLSVFGEVPFSTLFHAQGDVYTGPTGTFPWALSYYDGAVDFNAITVSRNPCRSVHIDFDSAPPGDGEDMSNQHGTVTLVQQSADPVSVTAAGQQVSSLDATVVPGQSWGVNLAQVEDSGFLFTWYLNGRAVCDSTQLKGSW